MDDAQAIRRLKNSDIGGLELLVARYQIRAIRTAFFITHDKSLAEDVVQDVFIRMYQRIRSFDERRPFEPYLMRSIVNAAMNAIRKDAGWNLPESEADAEAFESMLSCALPVEDQVEFAEREQEILLALEKLTPRQRAAVVQRYYLGMSESEMAEALESAPGTIKWLLNAARSRLRVLLRSERNAK